MFLFSFIYPQLLPPEVYDDIPYSEQEKDEWEAWESSMEDIQEGRRIQDEREKINDAF